MPPQSWGGEGGRSWPWKNNPSNIWQPNLNNARCLYIKVVKCWKMEITYPIMKMDETKN